MTWLTDFILRLAGPLVLVVVFALPALEAATLLGERLLAHLPHRLVDPRQVERATALVRRLGRPGPAGRDRRRCRCGAAPPAASWSP